MKRKTKILLAVIASVLLLLVGGCVWYVMDYYPADLDRIGQWTTDVPVTVETLEDGSMVYRGGHTLAGLIFYPGGKVEHTAYEPLMKELAAGGVTCVLAEMPLRLAVLDMDAAQQLRSQFPEISRWFIGGHSLGGSMAASYLEDCEGVYEGLVLLGAYSTADLSNRDLKVLCINGSEDRVLNWEKYRQYRGNLPQDTKEYTIQGGCHAYFGMYGPQDGDGTPAISNEEQIRTTARTILETLIHQEVTL